MTPVMTGDMKHTVVGAFFVLTLLALAAMAAETPAPVSVQPDDTRLVDIVRLIQSGMSESIINEQVNQSDQTYDLTVNDLLYLQQHNARESTIAALMAKRPGVPAAPVVAPTDMVFDDLELMKPGLRGFMKKDRKGRLVLRGNVLEWEDRRNSKKNFEIRIAGLEKVWYTCEALSSESFCYQINFKIVKGDSYRFRDIDRDSGSNAAITEVMEALRKYFPRLTFGAPDV